MTHSLSPVRRVRVHIITGFLGAGKTTLIRALLAQKPSGERWGVLVNEFGEVGVDGALLADTGVTIKEVAGGCMCCVAGVPMRVALAQLLRTQQLDCLLIEPSGLGHTQDILEQLRAPEFANTLAMGAVVTLVDPRKLAQSRYREHPVHRSQLAAATLLVASKAELASPQELDDFTALAKALPHRPSVTVISQGDLPLELLDANYAIAPVGAQARVTSSLSPRSPSLGIFDAQSPRVTKHEVRMLMNSTAEFVSVGWITGPDVMFLSDQLSDWLLLLAPLRAKALVNTLDNCWAMNMLEGSSSQQLLDVKTAPDSRIECIFDCRLTAISPEFIESLMQSFQGCVTEPTKLHKIE